jgi:hypothetical protein
MANAEMRSQIDALKKNIGGIYSRKKEAAIALCLMYAGIVLEEFRKYQASNGFWDNQTNTAYDTVFSDAIISDEAIGFFLSHLVEYGVYLELANDRKHEALQPIILGYYNMFKKDIEEIYAA